MKLTFDPMTIEHLGFKMYSHLPNAVAELVANAFDADASHVTVGVVISPAPAVFVTDDGHGMSASDLQDKYLRIGRNRVKEGERMSESGKRRAAGKKGLGKLALFGIGTKVEIRTKRYASGQRHVIKMDWDEMLAADGEYQPESWLEDAPSDEHGTTVTISSLKRKTAIVGEDLARSLARLFNYVDQDFQVVVSLPEQQEFPVTRDPRIAVLEHRSRIRVANPRRCSARR
ncbi:histidine kinase/DNA gyrase B/HSP90-like ATPase [Leucobacter luti]|uniref:Histidine kinase/DNA gyrase B/HSP90-like ATPase n=1 Tax=Leucobacter luti TaxID=340320 RepID=A0A4R6S666_9MICO|nr:ATP-binding protein [Leucobacter luti]TDP94255.1 histidine kinase/DNA gyrase B/HSP90-like ATPase [Leucobacter luti]